MSLLPAIVAAPEINSFVSETDKQKRPNVKYRSSPIGVLHRCC